MRTCPSCGFERSDTAEERRPCPLCGASEVTLLASEETLAMPPDARSSAAGGDAGAPHRRLGEVWAGRFRLETLLGRGGMGQVFRVRDLEEGTDLALKVLLPTPEADPGRVQRFKREIGILSKIKHPAVPRIVTWGTKGDELFFVSELVDGADLKQEIQRRGPWPVAEAVVLTATVADALGAAHELGIVHRDVKPNNIMIARDGTVRLLDFGLARGMGIDMTTLTRTGTVLGTPGYMSPEQFEGHVDERSDIYSLGVVLFELLTGRLPFTGQTPLAVAMLHRSETPPAPRVLRAELPAWTERVVLRCLEKDPAQRFASAAELASELRRPRHGRPVRRRLESGDSVLEDESDTTDWALVIQCPGEKIGWSMAMALRYGDRYFRLGEIDAPTGRGPWTYRFTHWPEGGVLRKIVDYEHDWRARAAAEEGRLSKRVQRWIFKGGKAAR